MSIGQAFCADMQISSASAISNDSCQSQAVRLGESSAGLTLFLSHLFIFLHDRGPGTGGYDGLVICASLPVLCDWTYVTPPPSLSFSLRYNTFTVIL
ncbi:hypothetical protein PoB_001072600 [Plakobranchus ocellatus]|uniref:Uncharacterized protein n=1 Tax=Plakobranchus ocellatus TaxID=259542 RepID=A0AAV3YP83_9GAST|nr:hypothetical protein PoB_001072600 [Plakobranchus ocellatus]